MKSWLNSVSGLARLTIMKNSRSESRRAALVAGKLLKVVDPDHVLAVKATSTNLAFRELP